MMCCINCVAQTYIEPVFERADYPEYLHINKIEITKDTTFVYCSLTMPPGSWGTISGETYLYNHETHEKYPLLKCDGLPISPQKRDFTFGGVFQISFYFPSIPNIGILDFIENPNKRAFNIYGVDVSKQSDKSHSIADIEDFYKIVSISESDNDTIKKKKILDYIDTLNDEHEKWQLLSNLSSLFSQKQDFTMATMYGTRAVEIEKKILGYEHPKYAASIIRKTKCSEKIKRSVPPCKTKCSFFGFPPPCKNAPKNFYFGAFFYCKYLLISCFFRNFASNKLRWL